MCLILFSYKSHPKYKLIIAANRDEFYSRPTKEAHWRGVSPDILAGKDMHAGGTWMGIAENGRIAALTNYRSPEDMQNHCKSRGKLVFSYLKGEMSPEVCSEALSETAGRYNGYNLLFGDVNNLYWYSNKTDSLQRLDAGVHGLSNHLLNTPWPKVERGKKLFRETIKKDFSSEDLLKILKDDIRSKDAELPETGVGVELERILSPMFIVSPEYGTRSSTIITVSNDNKVTFVERTYNSEPKNTDVKFEFKIL
ncbi:MAG: hypothetical protein C0602_03420 [Denitrovibrio sp.]|nr:MAG: hypothetical protein C0602_03420 [Denitrovibrio sp.]